MTWRVEPFVLAIPAVSSTGWFDLKIGGGGYMTGLDIHSDGTMVSRVDVYGAYIGSTTPGSAWRQLITTGLPASYHTDSHPWQGGGVYEIKIATTNSSILYMMYTKWINLPNSIVMKSTDKGLTWQDTGWVSSPGPLQADANAEGDAGSPHICGQKMGIDPVNANHVIVSTDLVGGYRTTDGGTTWIALNGIPTATTLPGGIVGIGFDPTSGTVGSGATLHTKRIIINVSSNTATAGRGTYVSTDGGATWTGPLSGSPTDGAHGRFAIDGNYYLGTVTSGNLFRISTSNTVTQILAAGSVGWNYVATDPFNHDRVVVSGNDSEVNITTNASAATPTWTGPNEGGGGNPNTFLYAIDVPWIQHSQDFNPSVGEYVFDPNVANRVWLSTGTGVFYTDGIGNVPNSLLSTSSTSLTIGTGSKSLTIATGGSTFSSNITPGGGQRVTIRDNSSLYNSTVNFMIGTVTSYNDATGSLVVNVDTVGGSGTLSNWLIKGDQVWVSQTAGIENLVAIHCIWPPGGRPVCACWDRPFFRVPATGYCTDYGPIYPAPIQPFALNRGVGLDYASNDATFLVGMDTQTGPAYTSSDGGLSRNWTIAPAQPTYTTGFAGSVAALDHTHWIVAPLNGGPMMVTANGGSTWSTPASLPASGWAGTTFFWELKTVCADRVTAGLAHTMNSSSATPGIWTTTDSGATWTRTFSGNLTTNDNLRLKIMSVPGQAGHFFHTAGSNQDPTVTAPDTGLTFSKFTYAAGVSTRNIVPNIVEVVSFGFSAPKPGGGGYPAVGVVAHVSFDGGVTYKKGVYRCDNADQAVANWTWTKIGDWPPRADIDSSGKGWLDEVNTMEGNPNVWNEWIIGFQGSGWAHYQP